MKKLAFGLVALAAFPLFAAQNNTIISFSTPGPDKYADGTTVANGECYALVWTQFGKTFAGFNADGTVVDPSGSELVMTYPGAKDGRCPPMNFQIDPTTASRLSSGQYSVYLLDTRDAAGVPMGVTGVKPNAINASAVSAANVSASGSIKTASVTQPAMTSTVSSLPADTPQPKITAIRIEDGKATITITGTAPYLQYNLAAGAEPTALEGKKAKAPKQGSAAGEITLEADLSSDSAFFQVNRN